MTLSIDCSNLNQALPWASNATIDHSRQDAKTDRQYFVEPIEIVIRNPAQMVEFFPGALGDPFRKLRIALGNAQWEFNMWKEEGTVHGLVIMNADLPIQGMAWDGIFTNACMKFLMAVHRMDENASPGILRMIITQPWFGKGFDLYFGEDDTDLASVYTRIDTHPIFAVPWKTWNQDLSIYNSDPMAVGYRDSFFRKVAKPMRAAGMAMEDNNFELALEILAQMADRNDWRMAGEAFVNLTKENAENAET